MNTDLTTLTTIQFRCSEWDECYGDTVDWVQQPLFIVPRTGDLVQIQGHTHTGADGSTIPITGNYKVVAIQLYAWNDSLGDLHNSLDGNDWGAVDVWVERLLDTNEWRS